MAPPRVQRVSDVARDDHIQLSLLLLDSVHYGSLPAVSACREWTPELIAVRGVLESAFEAQVRREATPPEHPGEPTADSVALDRRLRGAIVGHLTGALVVRGP